MQSPTCSGVRVRSVADAHTIFYAVYLQYLSMISRRLTLEERQHICAGSVFVWEERDAMSEAAGAGITRWTDGRRWSPSRVRDDFLAYHEKLPEYHEFEADPETMQEILSSRLMKQTYSAFVNSPTGRRKWHLVAYDSVQTQNAPQNTTDIPLLSALHGKAPDGLFVTARTTKTRARSELKDEPDGGAAQLPQPPCRPPARASHRPDDTPARAPSLHLPPLDDVDSAGAPEGARDGAEADGFDVAVRLPDRYQAQSGSLLRGPAAHDLAPLVYLRTVPYPPRHPIDSVALRSFDCRVRIV